MRSENEAVTKQVHAHLLEARRRRRAVPEVHEHPSWRRPETEATSAEQPPAKRKKRGGNGGHRGRGR